MKPRTRSIRNLFYRWGRALGLGPRECATALESAGIIILTPDGVHYYETESARALAPDAFENAIRDALLSARVNRP